MAGRYWREAASLIVVSRGRAAQSQQQSKVSRLSDTDYRLLFLKRSQKSSFMPSAFVFPGGVIDKADFSEDWLNVFKKHGFTNANFVKDFRTPAPLPELYKNKPDHYILPEVGFRIGAIRETFEESGVLLAKQLPGNGLSEDDLKRWRSFVHEDASQFIELFRELGGYPAIWDLHEWCIWLTPTWGKKRFDTAFFITFIDSLPQVDQDNKEVVGIQVASPSSILEQWYKDSLILPPPQVYELSRLLTFHSFEDLRLFSMERGKKGFDRYYPCRIQTANGIISSLPGDDLYPKHPDYEGASKVNTEDREDATLEELQASSTNMNRMEIRNMKDIQVLVNIQPKYGHAQPVNSLMLLENSKL